MDNDLKKMREATIVCFKSAMLTCLWVSLWLIFASCVQAEIYSSTEIASAIYVIEGGPNAKKPYGILSVPCNGEKDCRNICLNTVENSFTRWQIAGSQGDFLGYLANRYAPTKNASNDPQGLNKNWLRNLKNHLAK